MSQGCTACLHSHCCAAPVRPLGPPPPPAPLQRLNPDDLLGRHKYRKDKEERMKSVLEGGWAGRRASLGPPSCPGSARGRPPM